MSDTSVLFVGSTHVAGQGEISSRDDSSSVKASSLSDEITYKELQTNCANLLVPRQNHNILSRRILTQINLRDFCMTLTTDRTTN